MARGFPSWNHRAGCPILSRSWRKGGRPRTSPFRLPRSPGRWPTLKTSHKPMGAPSFRALGERVGDHEPRHSVSHAGCPILSRSWRKGGRPRTSPFRLPCWVPHPFALLAKGWETTNLAVPSPMLSGSGIPAGRQVAHPKLFGLLTCPRMRWAHSKSKCNKSRDWTPANFIAFPGWSCGCFGYRNPRILIVQETQTAGIAPGCFGPFNPL
jgi:hypothetical protein